MTRHGTPAEWANDFTCGLWAGALGALLAMALLMPATTMRILDLVVG